VCNAVGRSGVVVALAGHLHQLVFVCIIIIIVVVIIIIIIIIIIIVKIKNWIDRNTAY
jgi:uncharacterized membrane protein